VSVKLQRHFEAVDPVLARIVPLAGRFTLNRREKNTVFESLASAIASQQLNGVVARKIIGRLVDLHGGAFPTPQQIASASPATLRPVGFSFAKIAALQDLAARTLDGSLPADDVLAEMEDEAVIERLVAVRGVGRWTAQMLLMFRFNRPDVLPIDDFGVCNGFRLAYGLKGLPTPKALLAFGERWRPFRSAAAWYLWRAVDLHKVEKLPARSGRAPRIALKLPRVNSPVKTRPVKKRPVKKRGKE
jgi:DNA-3-methyladenine glycosylase II